MRLEDDVQKRELLMDCCRSCMDRIRSIQWFSHVSETATAAVLSLATKYLSNLGCDFAGVLAVNDAEQATRFLCQDIDDAWQLAERSRVSRLSALMSGSGGEGIETLIFNQGVTTVFAPIEQRARDHLQTDDLYLSRVAAGSAAEASYLYMLESVVNLEREQTVSDAFAYKFEIFALGHWPLCLTDGKYYVY